MGATLLRSSVICRPGAILKMDFFSNEQGSKGFLVRKFRVNWSAFRGSGAPVLLGYLPPFTLLYLSKLQVQITYVVLGYTVLTQNKS